MEINEQIINDELPKIVKNFNIENFNKYLLTDKQEFLIKIAKIAAKCLNCKIESNKFLFVSAKEINSGGASFSFYENLIRLNKDLLTNKIDNIELSILIDNAVHETVHFCQKQKELF